MDYDLQLAERAAPDLLALHRSQNKTVSSLELELLRAAESPGPGSYEQKTIHWGKTPGGRIRGISKADVAQENSLGSEAPPPTKYNVDKLKPPIPGGVFLKAPSRAMAEYELLQASKIPGPGHYEIDRELTLKYGCKISTSDTRSMLETILKREKDLPGPGSYDPKPLSKPPTAHITSRHVPPLPHPFEKLSSKDTTRARQSIPRRSLPTTITAPWRDKGAWKEILKQASLSRSKTAPPPSTVDPDAPYKQLLRETPWRDVEWRRKHIRSASHVSSIATQPIDRNLLRANSAPPGVRSPTRVPGNTDDVRKLLRQQRKEEYTRIFEHFREYLYSPEGHACAAEAGLLPAVPSQCPSPCQSLPQYPAQGPSRPTSPGPLFRVPSGSVPGSARPSLSRPTSASVVSITGGSEFSFATSDLSNRLLVGSASEKRTFNKQKEMFDAFLSFLRKTQQRQSRQKKNKSHPPHPHSQQSEDGDVYSRLPPNVAQLYIGFVAYMRKRDFGVPSTQCAHPSKWGNSLTPSSQEYPARPKSCLGGREGVVSEDDRVGAYDSVPCGNGQGAASGSTSAHPEWFRPKSAPLLQSTTFPCISPIPPVSHPNPHNGTGGFERPDSGFGTNTPMRPFSPDTRLQPPHQPFLEACWSDPSFHERTSSRVDMSGCSRDLDAQPSFSSLHGGRLEDKAEKIDSDPPPVRTVVDWVEHQVVTTPMPSIDYYHPFARATIREQASTPRSRFSRPVEGVEAAQSGSSAPGNDGGNSAEPSQRNIDRKRSDTGLPQAETKGSGNPTVQEGLPSEENDGGDVAGILGRSSSIASATGSMVGASIASTTEEEENRIAVAVAGHCGETDVSQPGQTPDRQDPSISQPHHADTGTSGLHVCIEAAEPAQLGGYGLSVEANVPRISSPAASTVVAEPSRDGSDHGNAPALPLPENPLLRELGDSFASGTLHSGAGEERADERVRQWVEKERAYHRVDTIMADDPIPAVAPHKAKKLLASSVLRPDDIAPLRGAAHLRDPFSAGKSRQSLAEGLVNVRVDRPSSDTTTLGRKPSATGVGEPTDATGRVLMNIEQSVNQGAGKSKIRVKHKAGGRTIEKATFDRLAEHVLKGKFEVGAVNVREPRTQKTKQPFL
eukprot:Rmarinus@m.5005